MEIIERIKNKVANSDYDFIDFKNEKLSNVLVYFQDEMKWMDDNNFAKTEQVKIFSKFLDREIKYITYVKLFERLIVAKKTSPIEEKKEESNDSKSEEEKVISETPIEEKKETEDDEPDERQKDLMKRLEKVAKVRQEK